MKLDWLEVQSPRGRRPVPLARIPPRAPVGGGRVAPGVAAGNRHLARETVAREISGVDGFAAVAVFELELDVPPFDPAGQRNVLPAPVDRPRKLPLLLPKLEAFAPFVPERHRREHPVSGEAGSRDRRGLGRRDRAGHRNDPDKANPSAFHRTSPYTPRDRLTGLSPFDRRLSPYTLTSIWPLRIRVFRQGCGKAEGPSTTSPDSSV